MSSFILKYIAVDKLLHFVISYAMTLTLVVLTGALSLSVFLVFLVGLIKEALDAKQPGNLFSVGDVVANSLGIVSALLVALMA